MSMTAVNTIIALAAFQFLFIVKRIPIMENSITITALDTAGNDPVIFISPLYAMLMMYASNCSTRNITSVIANIVKKTFNISSMLSTHRYIRLWIFDTGLQIIIDKSHQTII